MTPIHFEWTDFSDSFTMFARMNQLPMFAQAILGVMPYDTPDEKAKTAAIHLAEEFMLIARRRVHGGKVV